MAYLYMSIGHEGLGDRYRQLRLKAAHCDSIFHTKPPIKAANELLTLGTGKLFFFLLIKAAATIRNFTAVRSSH